MDLTHYTAPARAIMVYGASGSGKTYSVAEILKREPKSRYVYNEEAGLVTLKQAGVTTVDAIYAMAPAALINAVTETVQANRSTLIIDTISTFYDTVLREYLTKERVKLGEVPREAYRFAMEWIERLLYLCLDCVNAGTNVVCLCHERTTQNNDRVFWGPALAGQLPERVLRKFHAVVRCVRLTAGTRRRHYFMVPDSPSVGKDLLDIVGHGIENQVGLLCVSASSPFFEPVSQRKASEAPSTDQRLQASEAPPNETTASEARQHGTSSDTSEAISHATIASAVSQSSPSAEASSSTPAAASDSSDAGVSSDQETQKPAKKPRKKKAAKQKPTAESTPELPPPDPAMPQRSSVISRRQKMYLRREWAATGEDADGLDRFLKQRFNATLDTITEDQIAAVTLAVAERREDNEPPF